jgi:KaiC/GvpD/RAD55 family RecA-like ATPase
MAAQIKEYTPELEQLFLEMMLDKPEIFVSVQNIFNPDNFSRSLREVATFIKTHSHNHKILPTIEQINAVTSVQLKSTKNLDSAHYDWFLSEFEGFSQSKEIERAILKAADMLEKGDRSQIEKIIKDAVQVGLVKDIGTDYFKDPRERINAIKAGNGQVTTGWPGLDKLLYGGFNRGELNIFCANSGGGKSLFLMNLAINWTTAGLNGIYLTLELSELLCCNRADAMIANMSTKDIFNHIDDVELKVGMAQKKSGKFQIKYMQAQSNVNDIRAFVREYTIQTGVKPDFLVVDYLDLLTPAGVKIDPTNLFVKDKYVSEELRNLAKELNVLFITAAQFNRGAVDEQVFDHSNISGGISKINTADNVFGIFTSRQFRESGRYQVQLLKTRSSAGVGLKLDLEFDVNSLRITDTGLESNEAASPTLAQDILGKLKPKSVTTSASELSDSILNNKVGKVEVDSNKLKNMIANLKTVK